MAPTSNTQSQLIRTPTVAGMFYPSNPKELEASVKYYLTRHFPSNLQTRYEYTKSHHFLKVYLLQPHFTSSFGNLTLF